MRMRTFLAALLNAVWLGAVLAQEAANGTNTSVITPSPVALRYTLADSITSSLPVCRYYDRPCVILPALNSSQSLPLTSTYANYSAAQTTNVAGSWSCSNPYSACVPTNVYMPNATVLPNGSVSVTFSFIQSDVLQSDALNQVYLSFELTNATFSDHSIVYIDGIPNSACDIYIFNCSGTILASTLPASTQQTSTIATSVVSLLLGPYSGSATPLLTLQRVTKNNGTRRSLVASMMLPNLPPTQIAQPTIASEEQPTQIITSFQMPPAAIAYKQTTMCINLLSSTCPSNLKNVTYYNQTKYANLTALQVVNDDGWILRPVLVDSFNQTQICINLRWNDTSRTFPRIGIVLNNTCLHQDDLFLNVSTLTEMTFNSNGNLLATSCVVAAPYASPRSLNPQVPDNVWTVISAVLYVFALLVAIVLVRMNGIGVTSSTTYTDIASISVIFILVLSIFMEFYWLSILNRLPSQTKVQESAFVVAVVDNIRSAAMWSLLISIVVHWISAYLPKWRQPHMKSKVWFLWMFLMAIYVVLLIWHLTQNYGFLKCTYIDYLLNRNPSADLYISLLEPIEWWHSGEVACRTSGSGFETTYMMLHAFQLGILFCVFVLGGLLIRQGMGMSTDSMESSRVYNGALLYLVITVLSFVIFLGIQNGMYIYLYMYETKINIIVWLFLGEFCPILIPCIGFLVLQWNSKLFQLGGQSSSLTSYAPARQANSEVEDNDWKSTIACGEFDDTVMDEETQQFEYLRMQRTNLSALHSSMSFQQQSKSRLSSIDSNDTMVALCLQLYFPESTTSSSFTFIEVYQSTDSAQTDDIDEVAPLGGRRSSVRSMGLFESLIDNRRRSTLGNTQFQFNWIRRGFTETASSNQYQFGFCTGFSSVLYVPIEKSSTLRFLVYEMDMDSPRVLAEYVCPMDHLLHSTNAIATLSPTERSQETLVLRPSSILQEEPDAVLSLTRRFSLFGGNGSGQRRNVKSRGTSASGVSNILTVVNHPVLPVLKLKPTLVTGGDEHHHLVGTSAFGLQTSSSFCIAKHFQFGDEGSEEGAQEGIHVVEELLESVLPNEIVRQFLEQTLSIRNSQLQLAQNDLKRFEIMRSEKPNYNNIIDQIQGEADMQLVQQWLEQRLTKRQEYCAFLTDCIGYYHERSKDSIFFKKSVEKKESRLRYLPTNLHVQEFWVGPMQPLQSEHSRRSSNDVQLYEMVTVGAFAAHNCKFRQTIPGLQAQLEGLCTQQESAASVPDDGAVLPPTPLVQQSSSRGLQCDWRDDHARLADEIEWSLFVREDECHAQALAALVTSFCRHLEKAMMPSADLFPYLDQLYEVGYLFQIESLLSDHGKEKAMLQDFAASTAWLSNIQFELDITAKHTKQQKATSLHLHLHDVPVPGVLSVRLNYSPQHGFTVIVGIHSDSPELQKRLSVGHRTISVTPIIFTQGINEMQTLANKSTLQKDTVQDMINQVNLENLRYYCDKYFAFAPHKKEEIAFDLEHLAVLIQQAKAEYVKKKHPEILQIAGQLTRKMDGGRVSSCKSAKDRTAMSVTLEQGWILQHYYHLNPTATRRAVATMRSYGVRMDCVEKNIGKRQYAFNSLQRSMLPEAYRCPEATFGKGNAS
ncbi:inositol-3,4-bisphosphate 4-phosphatase [Thraustotheca clavata]|uniref:Inositol-3,4-bisphosphate 4-phosphatase n=1 Tax=Thraustotheca clavata TaxID=74557 RepID=A0A1W0A3Z5_9STRA|nr:inositol-3,4-bisphosphate 4-phosphatase [Thraustotheca clavata]